MTEKEKEELRRYRALRESLKKSQKKYREKKTTAGLTRSSVWVDRGKERAIALPIEVVEKLEECKKRFPVEFLEVMRDVPTEIRRRGFGEVARHFQVKPLGSSPAPAAVTTTPVKHEARAAEGGKPTPPAKDDFVIPF